MQRKTQTPFMAFTLGLILVSLACATSQPPTPTPKPTSTKTKVPTATKTVKPSATPRPTKTPDLAATQRQGEMDAQIKSYYDEGYLTTTEGKFEELPDFEEEWAQLNWYSWWYQDMKVKDFVLSGHFKWTSAYRSADISGCGFVFAVQEDNDHYAVFLDKAGVRFLKSGRSMGPTRGNGRANFGNPADKPVEADFTLIVNDIKAYILVDQEFVGEYALSKSQPLEGDIALSLLSGTNKDFGTRCEMTELYTWVPED